jgi:hypothetical protein
MAEKRHPSTWLKSKLGGRSETETWLEVKVQAAGQPYVLIAIYGSSTDKTSKNISSSPTSRATAISGDC